MYVPNRETIEYFNFNRKIKTSAAWHRILKQTAGTSRKKINIFKPLNFFENFEKVRFGNFDDFCLFHFIVKTVSNTIVYKKQSNYHFQY